MALVEKLTHAAEAKAKLITQFKDQTGFEGLLDAYSEQVQELEGVLFDLLAIVTDIDSQVGSQLDLIGAIVGEDRNGRSDASYLLAIKARILINKASGTNDEISTMIDLIVTNEYTIEEYYPAAFVVRLTDAFTGDADLVAELISKIRAGGVRATFEYSSEDDEDTFSFWDESEGEVTIPNGNFSNWTVGDPDAWTKLTTVSGAVEEVGSGEGAGGTGTGAINFSAAGAHQAAVYQLALPGVVAGVQYFLRVIVSYVGSGTLAVGELTGGALDTFTTVGEHWLLFTAGASMGPTIGLDGSGAGDITVDSIEAFTLHDLSAGFGGVAELIANGDFDAWTGDDPDDWTTSEVGFPNGEVYETSSTGGAGVDHARFTTGSSTTTPYIEQTFDVLPGVLHTLTLTVTATFGADPGILVEDTGGEFSEVIDLAGPSTVNEVTFTPVGASITLRISIVRGADGGAPGTNYGFVLSSIDLETDAGGVLAAALEA